MDTGWQVKQAPRGRGGRVVECAGLENQLGGNSYEGSNPSLSAIFVTIYPQI